MQHSSHSMHSDLIVAQERAYSSSGFVIQDLKQEVESQEYSACDFVMNNKNIKFRVARITPTKIGQFVTLWKRIGNGPIMPFDLSDPIDLFVVSVRRGDHLGQFVFPKTVLYEKGFVSKDGIGGKRAMRVYPPWDVTDSKQAGQTQAWQLKYFFEIFADKQIDVSNIKRLFN